MPAQIAQLSLSTRIFKGRDGWEARSLFDMDNGRVLILDTHKTTGGVVQHAMVNKRTMDGMGFEWDIFGDFSKRTVLKGLRCTEKTIREQHALALAGIEATTETALAYYAAKAPKVDSYPTDPAEYAEGASDPMDDVNYVGHPCHY